MGVLIRDSRFEILDFRFVLRDMMRDNGRNLRDPKTTDLKSRI